MDTGWVFGIDGGGTTARLRIESLSGELLFRVEGGSSNLRARARDAVLNDLCGLFSKAFSQASLRPSDCRAGFAGSAGIDREEDREGFAGLVRSAFAKACAVGGSPALGAAESLPIGAAESLPIGAAESLPIGAGNDAEPALVGAIGDVEGFLLIAGTGSIAYGRGRDGREARAGGYGHLLGDEGSAFTIAFEALKRGLRSLEGRDLPTCLLEKALAFFDLHSPQDIIPFIYNGFDKARIASFARIVVEARDSGDRLALALFDEAASGLAGLVLSVDARIGDHILAKRLAFRGGLIEGDEGLRTAVAALLEGRIAGLSIVPAKADAATGACILARTLIS